MEIKIVFIPDLIKKRRRYVGRHDSRRHRDGDNALYLRQDRLVDDLNEEKISEGESIKDSFVPRPPPSPERDLWVERWEFPAKAGLQLYAWRIPKFFHKKARNE